MEPSTDTTTTENTEDTDVYGRLLDAIAEDALARGGTARRRGDGGLVADCPDWYLFATDGDRPLIVVELKGADPRSAHTAASLLGALRRLTAPIAWS